jgi:hypothetical protein
MRRLTLDEPSFSATAWDTIIERMMTKNFIIMFITSFFVILNGLSSVQNILPRFLFYEGS